MVSCRVTGYRLIGYPVIGVLARRDSFGLYPTSQA
jgi:hypothetical protein